MESASKHKIAVSAGRVSGATVLSRILGLARDMFFAAIFGTTFYADAFNIAFVIPNFLRRVFGEGTLGASYIPVYTHYLRCEGDKAARDLAAKVFSVLTVLLGVAVILGALLAHPIVHAYAIGWRGSPQTIELTVKLTRLLFPYIFFVTLAGLAAGTLNSRGYFGLPAFAPAFLNIASIGAGVIILMISAHASVLSVTIFSVGTLVGGALQVGCQIPLLRKTGHRLNFDPDFKDPGVKWIGKLMLPGMLSFAVVQVNVLVDTLLATTLITGSVTALKLGNRIAIQPLGIFGVAITTAALPTLAAHAAKGDRDKLVEDFAFSMRLILALLIPSSIAMLVLAKPIVRLLFERGEFTAASSTPMTVNALVYYAFGLFAYGGMKAVVQAFYSLKDTMTPMKVAIVNVTLNIVLDIVLVRYIGIIGLAVATSISATVGFAALCWMLNRRLGDIRGREIWTAVAKVSLASVPMAVVLFAVAHFFEPNAINVWGKLLQVAAASLAGFGVLVGVGLALRVEEIIFILRTLLRFGLRR
jgi:putative peptidoglycan lipid II flippase